MKHMRTRLKTLTLAFAGAAIMSCESRADLDRKPDVVKDMVEHSMKVVDTGYAGHPHTMKYSDRLTKALMTCRTADLETLQKNNVTIALDPRLSQQKRTALLQEGMGFLYQQKDSALITMYDTGNKVPKYYRNEALWFPYGVMKLAKLYKKDNVAVQKGDWIMPHSRYHHWHPANTTLKSWQDNNPKIQTPPYKKELMARKLTR